MFQKSSDLNNFGYMNNYSSANDAGIRPTFGNDANTSLLLHMDGINESTTFTDVAVGGTTHTAIATGATVTTANKEFGTGSMDGGYLAIENSADFAVAGNDFTIDMWIYPTGSARYDLFSGATNVWLAIEQNNQRIDMWASSNGSGWDLITSDSAQGQGSLTLSLNAWSHVAFERYGDTWTTYIGGAVNKQVTSISGSVFTRSEEKRIGRTAFNGASYVGQLDEFRFSNIARYEGTTFTPETIAYY